MGEKKDNAGPAYESRILDSWLTNAKPWTRAIRERQVVSRETLTNQAIIDAVTGMAPRSVLDIGCGEGWLCRALSDKGIDSVGIDAIAELVNVARKGAGKYYLCRYEEIGTYNFAQRFDCAVSNFALLGKSSTEAVFAALPAVLTAGGHFIVQTLHPESACGDAPYQDGWRESSWDGFSKAFSNPAPWYFRTLESWESLFYLAGLKLLERHEPLNPASGQKQSLILIGQLTG